MVGPLTRKLVRDLAQLKGQVVTIALVVAGGLASFITLRSTYDSLIFSRDLYYERYRFADVFVDLKRAPEGVAERLRNVPGVAVLETRVREMATLPYTRLEEPIQATIVSLPDSDEPKLHAVHLVAGRFPERDARDEAVVLDSFAKAHHLRLGESVRAVVNGRLRALRVVGFGLSPEFVFPIGQGGMSSDPEREVVFWVRRHVLAAAYDLKGAFNSVLAKMSPSAQADRVLARIDAILKPYGARSAYLRDRQISHRVVQSELDQLQGQALMAPIIFFGVAAFLLNMVLSRLVLLQRPQIATLKALGYSNRKIAFHMLSFGLVITWLGIVIGTVLGSFLGKLLLGVYMDVFRFPVIRYRLDIATILAGALASMGVALVGSWVCVRGVLQLTPAEAMRPPTPKIYRKGWLGRIGVLHLFTPALRTSLREIERRPMRLLFSALAIAGATSLMVLARFWSDAFDHLLYKHLHRAMREDVWAVFAKPVDNEALSSLRAIDGVRYVEGIRTLPVQVSVQHRKRSCPLIAYPENSLLRHVLDDKARHVPVPQSGVMLTTKLAELLGADIGDPLIIESEEQEHRVRTLPITALVDEPMGLQAHATHNTLRAAFGNVGLSEALLRIDPQRNGAVMKGLRRMPQVLSALRPRTIAHNFEKQSGRIMEIISMVMTLFAATIAIGVVYNNARVALSQRSRDFATLRVLGYSRAEVSLMLLFELSLQVLLALPIGIWLGRLVTLWMITATAPPETYRMPLTLSLGSYAFAAAGTVISSAISYALVRRLVDRIDLVGALKAPE